MSRQSTRRRIRLVLTSLPLLALAFGMSAAATPAAAPEPGQYCPAPDILLIAAEDLSAGVNLALRSRAAHLREDRATAMRELSSLGTTLQLASGRGGAARTNLLIDAIIQARTGGDNAQVLAWFPLLRTSLLTLPDDAALTAAGEWIGEAEEILEGDNDGDPVKPLREARHMLACDGLDLPLQRAIAAQDKLTGQLGQNVKNGSYDYDGLVDSLRSALRYTLENNEN